MELNPAQLLGPSGFIPRATSQQTLDTTVADERSQYSQSNGTSTNETTDRSTPTATRSRTNQQNTSRHSAAYVRNYRLSRYRNALKGALPFRLNTISDTVELPLDAIGCITTCTFSWIRRYRVLDPPVEIQCRWPCWPFRRAPAPPTPPGTETAPTAAAAAHSAAHSTSTSPHSADVEATASSLSSPPDPSQSSTPRSPSPHLSRAPVVPLLPATDRCEPNAKRLLGLYKYEEQSRGRIGASMTRVAWQFCRTRVLLATALHTLAHCASVLMLAVFLQLTMLTIDASWSDTVPAEYKVRLMVLQRRNMGNQVQTFVMMGAVVGSLMAQNYLRSAAHAIGLRTAIRLRTACIGAVCSKSLKSAVRHPIAAHQIASLAANECLHLSEAVITGPLLVANLVGLAACTLAAACTLGAPGAWPMLGIVGLLPIGCTAALVAGIFYRRSVSFLAKKLSLLEEYYATYNPDAYMTAHEAYTKRFAGAIGAQFAALCRSEMYRPRGTVQLVALALVLGGTYLVWCDIQFPTETTAMTAIMFTYVLLVPGLVGGWLDAVQACVHGRAVLAKVKQALTLSAPELPKMRPTRDLKVTMSDAIFRWNDAPGPATDPNSPVGGQPFELRIDSLAIPKNSLVGITGPAGAGKTALVHALLGHLQLRSGEFYQRDKGSLYPEVPYLLETDSIRANIVFHDDWNEQRYRDALLLAGLHFNAGADERTTVNQVQDLLQLQRIGIARALYSDRDFVVLEEPLSAIDLEQDLSGQFEMCTDRLREQGKTVVVVSQNDSLLRHCQRVFVLVRGVSTGYIEYGDVARVPAYRQCVDEYAERKRSARHEVHAANLAGASARPHNISTEDLVSVEEQSPDSYTWISSCQLIALNALCVLDATYMTVVPILLVIYLDPHITPPPLIVLILFAFVPVFLLTSWLRRTWLNRIGRRHMKRLQRRLFSRLLGAGLAEQRDAHLGQLQHAMIENSLELFHGLAPIMHAIWVVGLCVLLCFFNKSIMFLAVMLPLADCSNRMRRYRRTVHRYSMLESETRLKLLHLLGNQLKGRVVIQSFDAVQRLRATVYRTVEENSSAELLLRTTIAYNQHAFVFWQAITLVLGLVLLNAYPYQQSREFGIQVYVYLLTVSQLVVSMGGRFQQMATEQQLGVAHWLIHDTSAGGEADRTTLKFEL